MNFPLLTDFICTDKYHAFLMCMLLLDILFAAKIMEPPIFMQVSCHIHKLYSLHPHLNNSIINSCLFIVTWQQKVFKDKYVSKAQFWWGSISIKKSYALNVCVVFKWLRERNWCCTLCDMGREGWESLLRESLSLMFQSGSYESLT